MTRPRPLADAATLAALPVREERAEPPWLAGVVERLHAEFQHRLTIEELARAAGVHPVRLSRLFRRRIGVGIGDYVLGLRVRRIEERLADPEVVLADLALETGFVDQSHMTRVFRRITGLTPGATQHDKFGRSRRQVEPVPTSCFSRARGQSR